MYVRTHYSITIIVIRLLFVISHTFSLGCTTSSCRPCTLRANKTKFKNFTPLFDIVHMPSHILCKAMHIYPISSYLTFHTVSILSKFTFIPSFSNFPVTTTLLFAPRQGTWPTPPAALYSWKLIDMHSHNTLNHTTIPDNQQVMSSCG